MQRERTSQEQAAFEAGQKIGEQIADALGKTAREVYRKAFPNAPFPDESTTIVLNPILENAKKFMQTHPQWQDDIIESTAIILDDVPALPARNELYTDIKEQTGLSFWTAAEEKEKKSSE